MARRVLGRPHERISVTDMTEGAGVTPEEAADALGAARASRSAILPFTDRFPHLDESWGYAVQDVERTRRLAAGEAVVGAKLGLTSEAKQRTMKIARPIVGFLTKSMLVSEQSVLDRMIHPRAEPEIAFRLGGDLRKPVSFEEAARLVEGWTVAIEVIDSRFKDFRFRLPDVLADNTSAAGVVLGEWTFPTKLDELPSAACGLFVDDELVQEGQVSAVLGHPVHSLVHLSEHLAERGDYLPSGSVVLSGSITDAVPFERGTVHRVEVDGFSPVELSWPRADPGSSSKNA